MKADGLLTMMMKEEKQERLEKEEIHKVRINNHLVLYQSVFKHRFSFQADFSISKLIIKPKEANSTSFLVKITCKSAQRPRLMPANAQIWRRR